MKKMRLPRKTKKEIKKISICDMPGYVSDVPGCVRFTQTILVTGKQNRRTIKLVRRVIQELRSMLLKIMEAKMFDSINDCFNKQNSQYGNSIFL